VTWTLGPETAVRNEEHGTATLDDRLSALARTAGAGITVGARFDPIIPAYAHTGVYREIIERLAANVDEGTIFRFELGVLRFPPGLWQEVQRRNPRSMLLSGEYLKDRTGKMRLYRPSRVRLYRDIAGVIRESFGTAPIELSMEDQTVWEDAGIEPPMVLSGT
jgi:spore photoproduct lyase